MDTNLDQRNERPSRILIVDDNALIHQDFLKILNPYTETRADLALEASLFETVPEKRKSTFQIDNAYQGEKAVLIVQQAKEEHYRYAMAFVDVRMPPGWDGVETTQRIWEIDPDIQIVICTAYADYSWEEMFKKIGRNDKMLILKKPFDVVEVLQLTHALTEKWRLAQLAQQKVELHDSLTGCYSRRYLNTAFQTALSEVAKGSSCSLLSIDIDDFKIVNDVGGHLVGDRVLVTCANLIKKSVRKGDEVIRMAGDEFLVILNHIEHKESWKVAERIRTSFSEFRFFDRNHHHFSVTVSIGITQIDADSSQEQLIRWADSGCYSAKHQGRNCVVKHDILTVEKEPLDWKDTIRDSILEDRFDLWFQPIMEISSGNISMQEALLRPRSRDGLILNPMTYLKAAERYKIAHTIDEQVILKALYFLKRFPAQNLTVNLSAQSISCVKMFNYIEKMFSEDLSLPSRVCFEITETTLISDIQKARELMTKLNELGFSFAIDDFGAGFSSFNYFGKLPIQYLKIDGSYIMKLEEEPTNQAVVRGVNLIAHQLNIRTIAEHVESAATLAVLADLKVDFAQGYFVGKPIPWK